VVPEAAMTSADSARASVCLLVLNYNGQEHLEDCLSSAVLAAGEWHPTCRVVLVDNRSTDGSVAFARHCFPSVEVVVSPSNDFLFSLNAVAAARPEEIIIVLNNDMRFEKDFIAPLIARLDAPGVFAAGAAIRTWDGSADTVGPRCARLAHCWFYKWYRFDVQAPSLSLDACGGAVAYRRSMFVALGGFDPLYRPGYYEDLDLSYRAWAQGWSIAYEPASLVYHKVSVSMVARFGETRQARTMFRNHVLFTAKNVGDAAFLAGFLLMLPLRALRPLLHGDSVPLVGILRALPRLPAALRRRWRRAGGPVDVTPFETVRSLDDVHV
jgi:GT2 family glycosyltransferase